MRNHPLGIYEKALAKDLSWPERLVLAKAAVLILSRCRWMKPTNAFRPEWTPAQRASLVNAMLESGVAIPSMCLSAHRRFPFGSRDEAVRQRAREIMTKAIRGARHGDPHHPVGRLRRLLRRARRRHPATFRRRAGVGGGTGRSGAGDAGGGDHGYRVYELHQQVEKVGRDAFVTVVHRLSRRRQPQRPGTT